MVYHDALVVSWENHYLADNTVEHGLSLFALCHRKVESVVRRHDDIIDRMALGAEAADDSTFHRPWELSLVLHKFRRQLGVNLRLS